MHISHAFMYLEVIDINYDLTITRFLCYQMKEFIQTMVKFTWESLSELMSWFFENSTGGIHVQMHILGNIQGKHRITNGILLQWQDVWLWYDNINIQVDMYDL